LIYGILFFQDKKYHHQYNIDDDIFYWGVPAAPSVSGSKSAAGSRVLAKPQKELPPVAFLWQRHIVSRLCGLSTYPLTRWRGNKTPNKQASLKFFKKVLINLKKKYL